MTIILLLGTQTQLAIGLPWLIRMSETTGASIAIVVLGKDHQALARHAANALKGVAGNQAVDLVAADTPAVIDYLRRKTVRCVVMIHEPHDDRIQADLFEQIHTRTVWLNAKHPPPDSPQQVFCFDSKTQRAAYSYAKTLFGFKPWLHLADKWSNAESADPNPFVQELADCERQRCDPGDLLVVPISSTPLTDRVYKASRALLNDPTHATVCLVSRGQSWDRSLSSRIRYWANHIADPMGRDARLQLSQSLTDGSQPNLEFIGLISASAMLAAFGLLQDSAAVIIGAMLIAPLMTPIMGAGLSLTHGNRPLFQRSLVTIAIGFAGAFISSFLFGLLVRMVQDPVVTSEMWGRCNPSVLDFCVGLVGGMAASYARTRSHLSSALAGAAIAAALVPPIATAGLQTAFGIWQANSKGWPIFGPLILVSVNVLTIMSGTSFVLYARGLGTERGLISGTAVRPVPDRGGKWATRMTVLLLVLVLLVLVWIMHPERLFR